MVAKTVNTWSRRATKATARWRSTTRSTQSILNIEAEHLDFYRDLDHIKKVFTQLADQTPGQMVYCAEDPVAAEVCARADKRGFLWLGRRGLHRDRRPRSEGHLAHSP